MLKFDKMKIVANVEDIEITDETKFKAESQDGVIKTLTYQQKKPYSLSIEVRYDVGEVVIEFTGKVLGAKYPRLISEETIKDCFEAINNIGFCRLDPEAMMEADVVKCDVTQDVKMQDMPEVVKFIKGNLISYHQYSCRILRPGTLVLEKNVVTNRNKRRLTLYDKEREMNMAQNREYVISNDLNGKYEGICRFELNLNTKKQIREELEISNTKLKNVLSSTAKPISKFISEAVIDDVSGTPSDGWKSYWQRLVLKDCGYDLERVEAKLRQYKSARNARISKFMAPFRELLQVEEESPCNISKQEILNRLNVSN